MCVISFIDLVNLADLLYQGHFSAYERGDPFLFANGMVSIPYLSVSPMRAQFAKRAQLESYISNAMTGGLSPSLTASTIDWDDLRIRPYVEEETVYTENWLRARAQATELKTIVQVRSIATFQWLLPLTLSPLRALHLARKSFGSMSAKVYSPVQWRQRTLCKG
jgi:hypothetical protein